MRVKTGIPELGITAILCLTCATAAICAKAKASGQNAQPPVPDIQYTAATPMGTDVIRLMPGGDVMTLMLTLECKELDGVKLAHTSTGMTAKDRDGNDVKQFPPEMTFRFTVGSRTKLTDHEPYETDFGGTAEEFQDTLQFRLKIFHGVEQTELQPDWQRIVGVPLDMPYNERIYRVHFKLPKVPASDRMTLEVVDSEGERVSKFPVQLL